MCKCKNACKADKKKKARDYFKKYLTDPKNKKKHAKAVKKCHENNPDAVISARKKYESKMKMVRMAAKVGYDVIIRYNINSNRRDLDFSKISSGVYSVSYSTYKYIRKSDPGTRIEILGLIKSGSKLK